MPTLLLHACCAPCSSYCLEYLSEYFKITLYFYNPNIYPENEYSLRTEEARRLISEMNFKNEVSFLEGKFDPKEFYDCVKGFEQEKEGGERCFRCYRLRLENTAKLAKLVPVLKSGMYMAPALTSATELAPEIRPRSSTGPTLTTMHTSLPLCIHLQPHS